MPSLEERLDHLEARLSELGPDLRLVRTLGDLQSTLNKIRYITEGVLLRVCRQHAVDWGTNKEPTLENMLGPIKARALIPTNIYVHLRTIQTNTSPGSHYQENPLGADHVQIALLALVDVLEWVLSRQGGDLLAPGLAPRKWSPRYVHPLQPARHFAGRGEQLERLRTWWRDPEPRDRVISIVAMGGTGKTALVEQLLAEPAPAGVFVWSFYEDQRTESLLGEALAYLGCATVEPGARLEKLRTTLATTREPHTFVFDGFETVQSSGGSGKLRGRIEDASIRLFVRAVAAGLGRARVLVTSRSKLVDLEDWTDRGYGAIALDDLDRVATRAVLRGWGVRGSDAQLDALHDHVGGHALSVAVLGSYIAAFCGGDPSASRDLPLDTVAEEDPLAARLARVLDRYAEALPADERDLLTRLAAFPRGATVELVGFLVSDPAVAGGLTGASAATLQALLERLVRRGLVYGSRTPAGTTYSAHPFLRQHLKRLLGVEPARIHESVRAGIAPTLAGATRTAIQEPALLDRYEQLIEHTRLAGQPRPALLLFQRVLGGYMNLGPSLGEYARGWRIASGLLEDPTTGRTVDDAPEDRAALCTQAGLFAQALGDASEARRLYEGAAAGCRQRRTSNWLHTVQSNLADLERLSGHLARAAELFRVELEYYSKNPLLNALAGHTFLLAGFPDEAARCLMIRVAKTGFGFVAEDEDNPIRDPLYSYHRGCHLLNVATRPKSLVSARARFALGLETALADKVLLDATRCRIGLGWADVALGTGEPRQQLELAREWALRSGHVEMIILCDLLATRIARAAGDAETALREAMHGVRLAESAGFDLLAVDLLVAAARAANGADRETLARDALSRATRMGYAWAAVDAGAIAGESDPDAAVTARTLAAKISHPLSP